MQSGVRVSLDRGVTDEGEPWFVFCRAEDDEVIVHFARIDGRYLISAPIFGGTVSGHDFRGLVRDVIERHPVLRPTRRNENVTLHPSALLVLLVASALLKMGHAAEAAADRHATAAAPEPGAAPIRINIGGVEHTADLVAQETRQYVAVLSAIALAAGPLEGSTIPVFVVSAHGADQMTEQAAPVHVSAHAYEVASSWGGGSGAGGSGGSGGGSVTPPPPPPPSPPADGATHGHDGAVWQMQIAPIGSGSGLITDLAATANPMATPATPAPEVAPANAAASPVGGPGLIQATHDLAGSLLQALSGNEPIVYSATLPAEFVAPLSGSVHTPAASVGADSHNAATMSALITPASGSSTPISVAEIGAAATGAQGTALPGPGTADYSAVLAIMQNFARAAGPDLAVLWSGNQIIEYDRLAVDHPSAAGIAVTYDFADGSHISLIGLPAELPHTAV